MKKILIITFIISLFCNVCLAKPKLVTEQYTVKPGDSLEYIANIYILKNTYGKREIREFMSGIRELNNILPGQTIHTNDVLKINYWVEEK